MFKKLFQKFIKIDHEPIKRVDVIVPENCEVIRLPKISDGIKYGKIAQWHVKEGDFISNGDMLAEIESDKYVMDLESDLDGKIIYLHPNTKVLINDIIVIIEISSN